MTVSLEDMTWEFGPLLNPKSIAIVGASESSFFASLLVKNLNTYGYEGRIYPVNPKYKELFGKPCYPSVRDLPEAPDNVVIIVRRELVLQTVKDAIETGAKSATIVSAGFGETEEEEWKRVEEEMRDLSIAHRFPIIGPNCLGAISVHGKVGALTAPIRGGIIPGNIALVMQSGGLLQGLALPFYQRGMGLSYAVSSGNNMTLDHADFIDYFLSDPNTDVICAYVEGFKQPKKFERVARKALEAGKPIIVLKVGRTQKAAEAAIAHTGSLAGSDNVINAVFEKYGVVRVDDFDELIETAAVFSSNRNFRLPENGGIGIIAASGGSVTLASDLVEETGVNLAELAEDTRKKLVEFLPPSAIVINPIDATAQILNDFELFRKTMQVLSDDPNVGVIIYLMAVGLASTDTPQHQKLLEIIIDVAKNLDKPLVITSMMSHSLDEWQRQFLAEHRQFAYTQGVGKTLKAVQSLLDYSKIYQRFRRESAAEPAIDRERQAKALEFLRQIGRRVLTEYESKQLLSLYGIPVSREIRATGEEEAVRAAADIGYPVVMKIDSPDILHKTDAGGVRVNLASEEEVRHAYREIMENARRYKPDAQILGVLVQEFVTGGSETIVGVTRDKQFGSTVMFGMGGIFVEIFKDSVFKKPPLSEQDALEMVMGIKGYPILAGARGKGPKDVRALTDALLRISALVQEIGDRIEEMDINPLLVLPEGKGVKAVDALIVTT